MMELVLKGLVSKQSVNVPLALVAHSVNLISPSVRQIPV